jgi:hypothetical protein
MKKPSTIKDWLREINFALDEAYSIQEGTSEISNTDLYKMAPQILLIYRSIDDEALKRKVINLAWSSVITVHNEIPAFKLKYKRCFVHAYLDASIFLKIITTRKAERVIDFLEEKGTIETWEAIQG